MPQQMVQRPRKRKKKAQLEFDAGKVFDPALGKANDVELDLDSARYLAQQGQGGDRRA